MNYELKYMKFKQFICELFKSLGCFKSKNEEKPIKDPVNPNMEPCIKPVTKPPTADPIKPEIHRVSI